MIPAVLTEERKDNQEAADEVVWLNEIEEELAMMIDDIEYET